MKKYLSLILALLLVFALCACGNNADGADEGDVELKEAVGVTIPAFTLYVGDKTVTDADMAAYPVYEVSATSTNSSGTESTCVYVGFSFKDVLEVAGITEFTTVKAVASDGYEVEVSAEMALKADTLIAISKDGEQMKDGPWFAPCSSETTGDYNKGVVAIAFDGASVDVANLGGGSEGGEATGAGELADKTDKVQFDGFSFKVNGTEVTNATLEGLHIYKMEVSVENSKGEVVTASYTGFKLVDVLEALGITDYTTVTVVANDGYEVELTEEYATSDLTLIAIEKDKELGEDGTIWVAPGLSTSSGDYCKLVVELKTK